MALLLFYMIEHYPTIILNYFSLQWLWNR